MPILITTRTLVADLGKSCYIVVKGGDSGSDIKATLRSFITHVDHFEAPCGSWGDNVL